MTDRPILFSAPMVRALIAGQKTQTRRFINPQPLEFSDNVPVPLESGKRYQFHPFSKDSGLVMEPGSIRIATGDRLYVREHWRTFVSLDNEPPRDLWSPGCGRGAGVLYIADEFGLSLTKEGERYEGERDNPEAFGKHRQAMHMPRWASRLTLIVTDVRFQRLEDISREDAIAEGATSRPDCSGEALDEPGWSMDWSVVHPDGPWENDIALATPQAAFLNYFYKINDYAGRYGDDPSQWPNPWVVAYSFDVIAKNIDQIEGA